MSRFRQGLCVRQRPVGLWLLVVLLVVGVLLPGAAFAQGDSWPGWRGDGSGRAQGAQVVLSWEERGAAALWEAEIPGFGISSPVVGDGEVYVTTARQGERARWQADGLGLLLCLGAATGWLVFRRRRGGEAPSVQGRGALAIHRLVGLLLAGTLAAALESDVDWLLGGHRAWNGASLAGVAAAVVVLQGQGSRTPTWAVALAVGASLALGVGSLSILPVRYGFGATIAALSAVSIVVAARDAWAGSRTRLLLHLDQKVVSFVTLFFLLASAASVLYAESFWGRATPAEVWLRSGFLVASGLFAAAGRSRASSPSRWIAALVLALAMVALFQSVPTMNYGAERPLGARLAVTAPGLLGAAWLLLVHQAARGVVEPPRFDGRLVGAGLATLAAFVLLRGNLVHWQLVTDHVVICLDAETGAERWSTVALRTPGGELSSHRTSHATPTPCLSDGRLVAHFGSCTACLDLEGRVLWAREWPGFIEEAVFGAGSSPVVQDGLALIVQEREVPEDEDVSFMAALAIETGDVVWRTDSPETRSSYGSPLVLPADLGAWVLHASWEEVVAYDRLTGCRSWSLDLPIQEMVASLVREGSRVYLSGGSMAGATYCLQLPSDATPGVPARVVWSDRRARARCSSPVITGGMLYTVSSTGIMSCFDAATGTLHWRERLGGGEYYASLLACAGRVYAIDEQGEMVAVAASSDFEVLARSSVGEKVYASPAVDGDRLLIRTEGRVVCFRGPSE